MNRMDAGIQPLTNGLVTLNAGLLTLSQRLPPEDQLTLLDQSMLKLRDGNGELAKGLTDLDHGSLQLEAGAGQLEEGARRLATGLSEAATAFEAGFLGSNAARLAAPVTAVVEITAPVTNNGPAFAPYFGALSLWVGAVMMSFIFYLRRLPQPLQPASRLTKWAVKTLPLLPFGLLQATALVALLAFGLKIKMLHPERVWLVAVIGSFAFVNLLVFFISIIGDAGRLLAVILLILQLSASAGIYPIQLSPSFYQTIHPYLPFSLLVRAFRATMYGAFDAHWLPPAEALVGFAVGAAVFGMLLARWKYVPQETYGPLVEL
jgi:putative membrane protein